MHKATIREISGAELIEKLNRPKMSDGEKAARLYLGKKQMERNARIDRAFLIAWACLAIAALATPFIIFAGL